jgi:hypothetical protein
LTALSLIEGRFEYQSAIACASAMWPIMITQNLYAYCGDVQRSTCALCAIIIFSLEEEAIVV